MRLICFILCCVFLIQSLESAGLKRLKICYHKKKLFNTKEADVPLEKSLAELLGPENDEIYIPGTQSINLNLERVISGNVNVTNITISGIRDITICIFPTLKDLATITLNSLKIRGDNYQVQGAVSDLFDIYGDGKFELTIEGIVITAGHWYLWPLNCVHTAVDMKLQKMKANFDNLMGGDEELQRIFNLVIGDIGPDVIDYYWPQIYDKMEPYIQKFIDENINKKTKLENVLTTLSSYKGVLQKDKKKTCFNLS